MAISAVLNIALTAAEVALKAWPDIIKTVEDTTPFVTSLVEQLGGKKLTNEERAEMEAAIAVLVARALEPLPPAQPGDPDFVEDDE